MLPLGFVLIFATWALAWFLLTPWASRTPSLARLIVVLCVGCSGSIAAVCIQ